MFGRQITDDDDQSLLNDEQAEYMTDLTSSNDNSPLTLPTEPTSAPSLAAIEQPDTAAEDQNNDLVGSSIPHVPVVNHDELLDIKQSALNELSPLVDHLEQTAEEKFRTTMMLIQASDNASLISAAYTAAKNISDDRARAQALLDVVNEINYFTNKHHANQ